MRERYARRMEDVRCSFERDGDGLAAVAARTALVDGIVRDLCAAESALSVGVAVVAVGGYGRMELFPHSDLDLLFCLEKDEGSKDAIRRVTQSLWDCGLRLSSMTRTLRECERFNEGNVELGFALLDRRMIAGDASVYAKLDKKIAKMMVRDAKSMRTELMTITRERHHKYGDTLFHLEPNIKECPGGLRDAHVAQWVRRLREDDADDGGPDDEFAEAKRFLTDARCFLHFRQNRDDNTLDWTAQDEAAASRVGLTAAPPAVDAAFWMRAYFRNARLVERRLLREVDAAGLKLPASTGRRVKMSDQAGFRMRGGVLELTAAEPAHDPAGEPEVILALFAAMAKTGARLAYGSESRIGAAIPELSAHLEEGPGLWRALSAILTGECAGVALRSMHALGFLDLILPEFHGIDALVIRDAYHRYTVDEHTFVVIDTLHALEAPAPEGSPDWRLKFGQMIRELQHPELLYLAALMHDTGKGRAGDRHADDSVKLAEQVLARLEMDVYDSRLVLQLIGQHLDMSAALRRDIFDAETVRSFAMKVQTHESLRMLTLFTYADIHAVHPDALTPWKAENLWRLSMHAANQMDRSVDEERVRADAADERVDRIVALMPKQDHEVRRFLEGFPERYLTTRTREQVQKHFEMASRFYEEDLQIAVQYGTASSGLRVNEITLVTRDRPSLFAGIAGAMAAWGMNVVTADGFANADGVVVDSFRFTDVFRTLELNVSERERFVESVREMVSGKQSAEKMLASRRRGKKKQPRLIVETKVEFDEEASTHSTLLQVVAQDVPGLLRAISKTLSEQSCNVEVALVDTEGEMAIDVFYVTHLGEHLTAEQKERLRGSLVEAIDANAQ